jgi:hypothetical protein
LKFARKEGEQTKILDKMGKLGLDDEGGHGPEGGGRPEIDRLAVTRRTSLSLF